MAFRPPTFNVVCDIYRLGGAGGTYGSPDVRVNGNLSPGRRVLLLGPSTTASGNMTMELLLPVHTDVRAAWNLATADCVEVPSGSKRFYTVLHVDDVAKGFGNEYRIAFIQYQASGNANLVGTNTAPVPLP